MADPFSIAAGSVGLLDVSWRVGSYLSNLNSSRGRIEQELRDLNKEVDAIVTVNTSIQALWNAQDKQTDGEKRSTDTKITALWRNVGTVLESCRSTMERLQILVKEIVGKDGADVKGKRDGVKKVLRKQGRDREVDEIRQQLSSFKSSLQILLTALNFAYARDSKDSTDVSLEHLSDKLESLGFQLQNELASLRYSFEAAGEGSLRDSIKAATGIASEAPLNRYFYIPRAVSSVFTGREKLLRELKDDLDSACKGDRRQQKRFVIYGLGGSGKTEFCCKFAQDNRQSFWGVFHVNASSTESIKHTYSNIAKTLEKEPSETAAKSFLAQVDKPWLLIIDNADDPKMDLEDVFPGSESGVILITTRNPTHRLHGTFGQLFYEFEKLDEEAASELILRAACEPVPWRLGSLESATKIAHELSFLPLALVQAGKAVMKRLCSLEEYLNFYARSWQRIRKARRAAHQYNGQDDSFNMNVYSSYEILFRGFENTRTTAAQDAVELLKTFSFMSNEELRFDLLSTAISHPRLQAEYDTQQEEERKTFDLQSKQRAVKRGSLPKRPIMQSMKGWIIWAISELQADRSRPVLPAVLRDDKNEQFDEDRLTEALDQLTQVSLISYHQDRRSYSMHPLIHLWIRERPQMSYADQAIWCQAAVTILTRSILLPPLDTTPSADSLRRHLLPHVRHVQRCQVSINDRIHQNRSSRRKIFPIPPARLGERQIWELAKFSWVYFQNALFEDAERLQFEVRQFVCENLGITHPLGRVITLALANTYWHQMRTNKAAELQEEVLASHDSLLGPNHHQTLKDMDTLGATRCYQARFHESKELHEKAIKGLTRLLGPLHEDTLGAVDNLGRTLWRYMEYDEARILHERAMNGLVKCKRIGPTHDRTLFAKECMAMSHVDVLGDLVRPSTEQPHIAYTLMHEVLEERQRKLGKEQPWTLLAKCDLARVQGALGDLEGAEQLLRDTVPVAARILGENHFGTLMGKTHLAQMVARQQRYEEAEAMFLEIIDRPRDTAAALDDGEHPDHILAMWYLVQCYEARKKHSGALAVCRDIEKLMAGLGGEGFGPMHPFGKKLEMRIEQLNLVVAPGVPALATASEASLLNGNHLNREGARAVVPVESGRSKSVDAVSKEGEDFKQRAEQVGSDPIASSPSVETE